MVLASTAEETRVLARFERLSLCKASDDSSRSRYHKSGI